MTFMDLGGFQTFFLESVKCLQEFLMPNHMGFCVSNFKNFTFSWDNVKIHPYGASMGLIWVPTLYDFVIYAEQYSSLGVF